MIDFIRQACKQLEIHYSENQNEIQLEIPTKWQTIFGGDQATVFKVDLNETHYLTQRLAKLLSDRRPALSYGKIIGETSGNFVYVWLKITIYKSMKEELLKGYCFNVDNQTIQSIEYGNLDIFESLEKRTPFLPIETIQNAYESIIDVAKGHVDQFVKFKQLEENEERDREIDRIETYYSLLAKEHANAETINFKEEITKKEEKELMIQEKEHLVEQQRIKHYIKKEETTIEPIAILAVEIH